MTTGIVPKDTEASASGISRLAAYRASLTQSEKDTLLANARLAAQHKRELREANKHLVKTEYLDAGHWSNLASKHGVRMPHQDDVTSVKVIRKYLKRCDVSVETFNEHYTSMGYFVKNNPRWSAYASAGVILELKDSLEVC